MRPTKAGCESLYLDTSMNMQTRSQLQPAQARQPDSHPPSIPNQPTQPSSGSSKPVHQQADVQEDSQGSPASMHHVPSDQYRSTSLQRTSHATAHHGRDSKYNQLTFETSRSTPRPNAWPSKPSAATSSQRPSTIPMKSEADSLAERVYTPRTPVKASPIEPDSVLIPYSPHTLASPQTPVFAPSASNGPNGIELDMHQPGQVAHPNMRMNVSMGSKGEFAHSLCECGGDVGTCMTGLFCPCILDSKTAYRLSRKSSRQDPTEMLGFSACNTRCGVFLCGLCCIFPLILRTRIRHVYKLQGNFCSDIIVSCCCCCCVAIQNEREVREREDKIRQNAGPAAAQYRSDGAMGMVYAPGGT